MCWLQGFVYGRGASQRNCPEKDFIAGTNRSKITPTASPRYYHVDLQCIRRRHIDWNASLHKVDCDGVPEPEKQFVFNCLGL